MWMESKAEVEEASRSHGRFGQRVLKGLLLCTGDMEHLDKSMQGRDIHTIHYYNPPPRGNFENK